MRKLFFFSKSILTAGVLMTFAVLPFSQAMAQDTVSSSPASSISSSDETLSAKTGDTWITTKVKSELADAKNVKSTDISVTTTEGVVALTGTVTSTKEKNHVIHITKTVKGVKSVDASGLTVASAGGSSPGQ
jgi:hyperosmotically inducible periplasmic protein